MDIIQNAFLTGLVCFLFSVSSVEAKPLDDVFFSQNSEKGDNSVSDDKFFTMMSNLGITPLHLLAGFIGMLIIDIALCWLMSGCLKTCKKKPCLAGEPLLERSNTNYDSLLLNNSFEILIENEPGLKSIPFLRGLPFSAMSQEAFSLG